MSKKKFDGVIDAVRYDDDGKIIWVRGYERKGFIFSDLILFSRQEIIDRLEAGKKFYTGNRHHLMGHNFDVNKPLRLVERNGEKLVIAGDTPTDKDHIAGVPLV
jgi:hypothetical protein